MDFDAVLKSVVKAGMGLSPADKKKLAKSLEQASKDLSKADPPEGEEEKAAEEEPEPETAPKDKAAPAPDEEVDPKDKTQKASMVVWPMDLNA